jgi:hypothetical protein
MKKFQAPNVHCAGVSHIYFSRVLAFFCTPRKCKNLRKNNPFCFPILDTKDIDQCLGVKVHPTKMGSNLVVLWLFVLTTRGKWVPNKYAYEIVQDSPFGLLATNLLFPRLDTFSKQEYRR